MASRATQTPQMQAEPPRLTRAILFRLLWLFELVNTDDEVGEGALEEWTELSNEHAAEVLALAIAAFDRLEPKKRGAYEKHALGLRQQRLLDLLEGGPLSLTQIVEQSGIDHSNARHGLLVLKARGFVTRGTDRLWGRVSESDAPPLSEDVPPAPPTLPDPPQSSEPIRSAARNLGHLGGMKGGPARAAALSPDERSAAAKKAADARWGERKNAPESRSDSSETLGRPDWMPEVVFNRKGKVRGAGKAVLAAFARDESFPLPDLARFVYGSSDGSGMRAVKKTIENLRVAGHLVRTGAVSWRLTKQGTAALNEQEAQE